MYIFEAHITFEGPFHRTDTRFHRGDVSIVAAFFQRFTSRDAMLKDLRIDQSCKDTIASSAYLEGSVDFHEELAVDDLFAHLLIGSSIHWLFARQRFANESMRR
jgi:hypothetical protein